MNAASVNTTATRMPTATQAALSVATDALAYRAKVIDCYGRAILRAAEQRMVAYHNRENDTWEVPSTSNPGEYHIVRHLGGSDWANLSCSGPKCGKALACTHRATVAYARKNHISAVKPRCAPCDPTFCDGGCPDAPVAELERTCLLCGKPEKHGERCPDCFPVYREALAHSDTAPCRHGISVDQYCPTCEASYCFDGMTLDGLAADAAYHDQLQQERDMLRDAEYDAYTEALAAEGDTAQEPAFDALTAERIAFAAMLNARQAGDESVRALREAVSTQAARWLPSATGAITRMPVVSALDSLF